MKVDYIDHMGSDLSVVNAARVSFDKTSDWHIDTKEIKIEDEFGAWTGSVTTIPVNNSKRLKDSDAKLINYLASHGHWSPFAHTSVCFRFKAPIFVARQLVKHQVGLTWNEVSRRYVKNAPELWWPEKWRKAAENVKQGSSDEEFDGRSNCLDYAVDEAFQAVGRYEMLVHEGMCPEQARMFLPLNTYTEWIWTGSLYAWARVWKQRTYPTTQKETQECVKLIGPTMERLFPVSWADRKSVV